MRKPIFITGIGTGVGKTVAAAIVTEALNADYWKPVQSGYEEGTDHDTVQSLISNKHSQFHPEVYKLLLPASPHIAAREEGITIELSKLVAHKPNTHNHLVIEGAGGLLVPVNDQQFIADMIPALDARVILVSRNYLGSINHSLLTAEACRQRNIEVIGWLFNDQFMQYEEEIVGWTGIRTLGSIPLAAKLDKAFVAEQAARIRPALLEAVS
jgi:dethiobiotin synthetase